ncbi:uncharacterized protein LOC128193706 [Vigna angularis]|nr:uncharacterized protein LOC128193706 [Vigna angularis]
MCDILWQDSENFVDDGIQIEPFNLDKEREEGYFHAAANFVEYVRENEIKDAWLDNIEFDPKYSALKSVPTNDVDEGMPDLSSKDIAIMKRRIANVLEPGETAIIGFLCGQGVVEFLAKEGYEKLARAKEGPSNQHLASGEASSTGEGDYDMFADEDDNSKPSTDENNTVSQSSSDAILCGGIKCCNI